MIVIGVVKFEALVVAKIVDDAAEVKSVTELIRREVPLLLGDGTSTFESSM
jgi:hypothetical protein